MYSITHGNFWVLLFLFTLMQQTCEGMDCPRIAEKIEHNRKCRDLCSINSQCPKKETCNCDDACGMTCFNKTEIICIIPSLENGRVSMKSSSTTSYGTLIQYQCNAGYMLSDNEQRTCRSDGKWSGPTLTCTPVLCSHPPYIKNGHFTPMKQKWPSGSHVIYRCDNSFHFESITGTEFRFRCGTDGNWIGSVPICVENKVFAGGRAPFAYCKSPAPIANGWLDTSGNGGSSDRWLPNDRVTYNCFQKFELVSGNKIRVCTVGGGWTGLQPRCVLKPIKTAEQGYCKSPENIDNGWVENDRNWGDEFEHQPTLFDDDHVAETQIEIRWRTDDVIVYRCKHEYELVGGSKRRVCKSDGTWTGLQPRCITQTIVDPLCPSPISPSNGIMIPSGKTVWTPGDSYTIQCNVGYRPLPTNSATCGEGGTWSIQSLRCELIPIIYCNDPSQIANGRFESAQSSPWRVASVVTYSCRNGFNLIGGSQLTCNGHGNWEGLLPRCEGEIRCDNPVSINNGRFESAQSFPWKVRSVINYRCRNGYILIGHSRLICNDQGKWEGSLPRCEVVHCNSPVSINDGRYESAQNPPWKVASVITYRCRDGFSLLGNGRMTCNVQGEWEASLPRCQETYCNNPISISNGQYETTQNFPWRVASVITYRCKDGFNLIGVSRLTCNVYGRWEGALPRCEAIHCDNPVQISNGWFESSRDSPWEVTSVITYRCRSGFSVVGNNQLTCNQQGKWDGSLPICEANVRCGSPVVFNGVVMSMKKDEWKPTDQFSITCDKGFERPSPDFSICGENGLWSPSSLSCKQTGVRCGSPVVSNGVVWPMERDEWHPTDKFSITCNEGFEQPSPSVSTCDENGSWTPASLSCKSSESPSVVCLFPEKVENGWIVIDQKTHSLTFWLPGDAIIYKCKGGYKLVNGNERRVCSSIGQWTGTTPTCTLKTRFCESPVIENGFYSPSGPNNWIPGYPITINCNEGFEPPTPNVAKCQADGTWSIPLECTKKKQGFCLSPSKIENGWIENVRNVGQTDVHQLPDSDHSQDEFVLEIDGEIVTSQLRLRWLPNDVIMYLCKSGYELKDGDERRVCTSDGSWTGSDPKCESKQQAPVGYCQSPPMIENGWIEQESNVGEESPFESEHGFRVRWLENDVILYKCKDGFELFVGSERRVCTSAGSWTGGQPICLMLKNDDQCGEWRKLSSGVLYAVTKEKATFYKAFEQCEQMGGLLATSALRNRNTYQEVLESVNELSGKKYWIGLTDIEKETGWKWIDGVEMSLTTVLKRFYYKDIYWGDEHDCAYVTADPSKEWRAGICDADEYYALCQKDWCEILDWKTSAFPRGFEAVEFDNSISQSDAKERCKHLGGWVIDSWEVKGDLYINPDMLPSKNEEIQGRGLFALIGIISGLATMFNTVKKWIGDNDVTIPVVTTPTSLPLDESEFLTTADWTRPTKEKIRSERSADDVHFICERHAKSPDFDRADSADLRGFDLTVDHDISNEIETLVGRSSKQGSDELFQASGDEVANIVTMVDNPSETNTTEIIQENFCEPNPCLNGCRCEPSALYGYDCKSENEKQYIGNNCEFESPTVTCGHDAIEVTLSAGHIREMDNGDGNGVMYVAPNERTAKNTSTVEESCLFGPSKVEDIFEVKIPFPYDSCGTIPERNVDGKFTFSNTIWFNRIFADVDVTVHSSVVEFSCSYQDTYKMTSLVDAICCPTPPLITSNGVFKFRSTMWADPPGANASTITPSRKLRTKVRAVNGVVSYRVGEILYISVAMTSSSGKNSSLAPTLKTCWMSPDIESTIPNLRNGDLLLYPTNNSQLVNTYGPINTPSAVHFGFQLIKAKKSTRVYLHCQIQVLQKRSRRSADDVVYLKENRLSVVTKGPIEFIPEEPDMENSEKNDEYNHAAQQQIVGISIFGILFLLLLMACCLVHVRNLHEREQVDINRNHRFNRFSTSSSKHSSVSTVTSVVS